MPRHRKPARLWQREDGAWIILDRDIPGGQRRTGHRGARGRAAAEDALAEYLRIKKPRRTRAARPSEITVGEVLDFYVELKGPEIAGFETLAYCVKALAPFWGKLTVEDVVGSNCRAYEKHRAQPVVKEYRGKKGKRWKRTLAAGPARVRRELGVLNRALKTAVSEGKLTAAPPVTLPGDSIPRERWLTRKEAAKLLRAAAPHLRRFIVISLATGTRASTVLGLRLQTSLTSGYLDPEAGVVYRRGARERESNKRRGAVRMTDRLQAHARRWIRFGGSHAVLWKGKPLAEIDTAFAAACRRAGIENVTIHDLKRTAVTWAFQRGMTLEDAADWFSTTPATLLKYYRAHSPHYQERAKAVMELRAFRCSNRCKRRAENHLSAGAGEGIRTLDPNLGKVVLYP